MRISRKDNIVQIEIVPSDCPPGYSQEMMADVIYIGMTTMAKHFDNTAIELSPEAKADRQKALEDFKERWEIL